MNRVSRRAASCLFLCAILVLPLISCAKKSQPLQQTHFALDTVINISVYDGERQKAMDDAISQIDRFEQLFSRTIEGSDVWRINHANGQPVQVAPETIEIIRNALRYSELSGGRFDITIAPVSSLWNFDSAEHVVPDPAAIAEGLKHVDYHQIKIDGDTVQLSDPKGAIDLGGIAKGYIADKVAQTIKSHGVTSALINLGGNVLVIGHRPDGTPWKVGIQGAFQQRNDAVAMFPLTDHSVVTSGIYERYFEVDGKFYHHILNVSTGYPVENDLASVSILSEKSSNGDGLSSTCFILGEAEAKKLIESLDGIEAVFIKKDGTISYTSGIGTDSSAKYQIKLLEPKS